MDHKCPSPSTSSSPASLLFSSTLKGTLQPPSDLPLAKYVRQNAVTGDWGSPALVKTFTDRNIRFLTFYDPDETQKVSHFVETESWQFSEKELFQITSETFKVLERLEGSFLVQKGSNHSKRDLGCFYKGPKGSVVPAGSFLRFYVGEIKKKNKDPDYSLDLFSTLSSEGKIESWVVDASRTGNEMRFINHSHLPNVAFLMAYVEKVVGAFPAVVTIGSLKNNTELLADYDSPFEVSSLVSLFSSLFSLLSSLFSYLSLSYPVLDSLSYHLPFRAFLILSWMLATAEFPFAAKWLEKDRRIIHTSPMCSLWEIHLCHPE
jgi:hypothetical protein